MKSNLICASILAIAALTSVSSFAESQVSSDHVTSVSTKTRADVRNELMQAEQQGYAPNHRVTGEVQVPVTNTSPLTRAQVVAQFVASGPHATGFELDHNYPDVN